MRIRFAMTGVVVFFASFTLTTKALAADRVQAGQWETKMTIGAGKPIASEYCITAAEAKLMNGDVATLRKYLEQSTLEKTKGRCTVKDVVVRDNTTAVTMACGKTELVGTTTYHGDHYESTSTGNTKITGKRVGACP
jgi:HAMP domain-containing protein